METPLSADLLARLGRLGPPLGALAPGRIAPALDAGLAAALAVDRPTRDRLVIFDPASAPLLRPLLAAEDLRPWCAAAAGRWLVAVPRAAAGDLAARHPALARHLDALPPPLSARPGDPWWALPPAAAATPPPPRLILGAGGAPCAWDESAALVGGPATVIAPAEPYWLALLGSRPGARLAAALGPEALPVPDAPGPARANLEGLALAAAALAAQLDALERAALRRLVADFGPPGVAPGPRLRRWWELSFEELHAAVLQELRNDIPERFRPTWAEIHADQRATHREAGERLAALQAAIDTQVAALYGLGG
jgi:hypothetical protein